MLLNKSVFAVRHAADKSKMPRPNLESVYLENGRASATDGAMLATIKFHPESGEDFPVIDGFNAEDGTETLASVLVPVESVESILKAVPKKSYIPVCQKIAVDVAASNTNGSVKFAVTDLENPRTFNVKKVDMQFPQIDNVIPNRTEYHLTIGLNIDLLEKACKIIREVQGKRPINFAKFEFQDDKSPVKITTNGDAGEELTVVIMPCTL